MCVRVRVRVCIYRERFVTSVCVCVRVISLGRVYDGGHLDTVQWYVRACVSAYARMMLGVIEQTRIGRWDSVRVRVSSFQH